MMRETIRTNETSSRASHAGVGIMSILVIVLIVCLTALGILSLVSARSSQIPCQKRIESITAYYQAEAALESAIADADEAYVAGTLETNANGYYTVAVEAEGFRLEALLRFAGEGFPRYIRCAQQRISSDEE